jgi:hypothetical protein
MNNRNGIPTLVSAAQAVIDTHPDSPEIADLRVALRYNRDLSALRSRRVRGTYYEDIRKPVKEIPARGNRYNE